MSIGNKLRYKKVCIGSCVSIQIKTRLGSRHFLYRNVSCIWSQNQYRCLVFHSAAHTYSRDGGRVWVLKGKGWRENTLNTFIPNRVSIYWGHSDLYDFTHVCLSVWVIVTSTLARVLWCCEKTERWRIKTRYTFLAVIQIICSILEVEKNSRYFKLSIFHSTRDIYLRHRNSLYLFIRL